MRTWQEFKKTMRREDDQFALARAGDVEGLRRFVSPESIERRDVKGYSALMLAAYHGHLDAVRFLLQAGADPNTRDLSGNTVLMGAAFKGYLDVVELLVRFGADVVTQNPRGLTALHFAQMFGRSAVAGYLKSLQHKPEGSRLMDVLSGWSSFLFPKWSVK